MNWATNLPLPAVITIFVVGALVILVAGVRLVRLADELADITGLGEAVFGAALLGGSTSLPGIITSVTTAAAGFPQLAMSNAIGGIAAQTAFIVVADLAYRKANLEHAAASLENIVNGTVLCSLLAVVLLAEAGPDWSFFGVHPASLMILGGYAFGLRIARRLHANPSWHPHQTRKTNEDEPDTPDDNKTTRRWVLFATFALTIGGAGYLVSVSSVAIVESTGLSQSLVGALFTAVATSLPELATAVAAVRHGAPTLAVGGIIGGNAFDVLFVFFADIAYRDGSIYHAVGAEERFLVSLAIIMTSVLLLGMVRREESGPANIGFEGVLVLALYFGGVITLMTGFG